MATKPSIRADFRAGDGGTKWGGAVYMARWISTFLGEREEKGPWLEIATATVAA